MFDNNSLKSKINTLSINTLANLQSIERKSTFVLQCEGEYDSDSEKIVFSCGMGSPMEDAFGLSVGKCLISKVLISSVGNSLTENILFNIELYQKDSNQNIVLTTSNVLTHPGTKVKSHHHPRILLSPTFDNDGTEIVVKHSSGNVSDHSRFRMCFYIRPLEEVHFPPQPAPQPGPEPQPGPAPQPGPEPQSPTEPAGIKVGTINQFATYGLADSNGVGNISGWDFAQDLSGSLHYVIIDETNYQNVFVHDPAASAQEGSKFVIFGVEVTWDYSTQILHFPQQISRNGVNYNLTIEQGWRDLLNAENIYVFN